MLEGTATKLRKTLVYAVYKLTYARLASLKARHTGLRKVEKALKCRAESEKFRIGLKVGRFAVRKTHFGVYM